MDEFKEGQLIIYSNGNSFEIGKIKTLKENGAFVWYHSGNTAAFTGFSYMSPIINEYCIKKTILGGE